MKKFNSRSDVDRDELALGHSGRIAYDLAIQRPGGRVPPVNSMNPSNAGGQSDAILNPPAAATAVVCNQAASVQPCVTDSHAAPTCVALQPSAIIPPPLAASNPVVSKSLLSLILYLFSGNSY